MIALGSTKLDDKDGIDTSTLSVPARNRLMAGKLYQRYEKERVGGLFTKLKGDTSMAAT